MSNPLAIALHATGAETASGTGASVDLGDLRSVAKLEFEVSAVSGTLPTLDVSLETSPTGVTWRQASGFAQSVAPGLEKLAFGDLDRYLRAKWVIGGTSPSFTFELAGSAEVVYAGLEDLPSLALPDSVLADVSEDSRVRQLLGATGVVDGYLSGVYSLPLTAWGDDLRRATAHIAAYDLMVTLGYKPDEYDENIRRRYLDAIAWLQQVAARKLAPAGLVDSTPTVVEGASIIYTESKRGW